MAITHPDEDYLAGLLPILRGYRVDLFLDTTLPRDTPSGQAWISATASLDTQHAVPLTHHVSHAHHEAKQTTPQRFLEAVSPQMAVISVGVGNRFGHPAPAVLERLAEAGAKVWRTDECGDVEIVTDGERLWVRTGKPCRRQ